MMSQIETALSWLSDILVGFFETVAGFFIQFFPDKDVYIMESIDQWGDAMAGFDLTFNYFYFVNMEMVAAFFNVIVAILAAFIVYTFIRVTFNVISQLVEMIPVVE